MLCINYGTFFVVGLQRPPEEILYLLLLLLAEEVLTPAATVGFHPIVVMGGEDQASASLSEKVLKTQDGDAPKHPEYSKHRSTEKSHIIQRCGAKHVTTTTKREAFLATKKITQGMFEATSLSTCAE